MPLVDHALNVAHGAIVVCSVRGGVDANCGRAFDAVKRCGKPGVIFLNGIDEADDAPGFDLALDTLGKRLGIRPVVLFAPAHVRGTNGSHLLNVLEGTLCTPLGCDLEGSGIQASAELASWAVQLRNQQIESLAAVDEEMMEAYLQFEGNVPRIMIEAALRRAVGAGMLMPLVAGSAKSGLGIDALQSVVQQFIPHDDGNKIIQSMGLQAPEAVSFSADKPFVGWVYAERHKDSSKLLEVRVLDGTLFPGMQLKLVGEAQHEFTVAKVMAHGLKGALVPARAAGPGDLVVVPAPANLEDLPAEGLVMCAKDLENWTTWSPAKSGQQQEMQAGCTFALNLAGMQPRDQHVLMKALQTIQHEGHDGLRLEDCQQTGQHLLSLKGLLHLELLRERLAQEYGIKMLSLAKPKVVYRSTVRAPTAGKGTHCKDGKARARKGMIHQSQVVDATVSLQLAPGEAGSGVEVLIPEQVSGFAKALEEGVRQGLMSAGPGASSVTDVKVSILQAEISVHGDDESLRGAAAEAVAKAFSEAWGKFATSLLEPVVDLQLEVPQGSLKPVLDDLGRRRGTEVWGTQAGDGDVEVISAEAPLSEVLDYPAELQKLTIGEGICSFKVQCYREVPAALEADVRKELGAVAV